MYLMFCTIYSHCLLVFHFILYLAKETKLFGCRKETEIQKREFSDSITELINGLEKIPQVSQPFLCTEGCFTLFFLI